MKESNESIPLGHARKTWNSKLLRSIGFSLFLLSISLCSSQLTESNINECPPDAQCAYLQDISVIPGPAPERAKELLTKNCSNISIFCARLDIKPMKTDPCRHEFTISAINANSTTWVGLAISSDFQMLHDYAFYCFKEESYLGLIVRRDPGNPKSPVVNIESEDWRPNPEIIKPVIFKKMNSTQDKYSLQCRMRTHSFHWVHENYPVVILGSGYDRVTKKNLSYVLHMASGNKNTSSEKKGLYIDDYHDGIRGSDKNILNQLKAPVKYRKKCAASKSDLSFALMISTLCICLHSQL